MNHPFDLLEANLLDLLYELREASVSLIVGGGYGLYLKRRHLQATGKVHLLPLIPEARSTNDLDMFLATEILADLSKAKAVLAAVQRLEFTAVENKENFQFIKRFPVGQQSFEVKIDFLTPMPDNPTTFPLHIQDVRVRNKKSGGIHAFKTKEAIAVEENPIPVALAGLRTTGEKFRGQIYLPQAYPYLLMKLFAFRDWETNEEKVKRKLGNASKHALDVYSIVAMMTEEELAAAEQASRTYQQRPEAQEAAAIVQEFFARTIDLGNLRLREHQDFPQNTNLTEFISVLKDLLIL